MGKVRMIDIAQKVGVSAVTVHNALTGKKGVSDDIREEIKKVANEMGYQQSQGLKLSDGERFINVGVIISEKFLDDYDTFYWRIYQEIALVADEKQCMVTVDVLKKNMEDYNILPRSVINNAVDAIIIIGELSHDYIKFIKSQVSIPIVFLDFYDKDIADNAVVTDNFYGMYILTEYLFENGFNNIAYVGSIHSTSSIMDRYCGYYKAIIQHGATLRDDWIIEDRDAEGSRIELKIPSHMPEAFVCNCDMIADILIEDLKNLGYRIPEDISVVGFDNFLATGNKNDNITTYEVNMKAMAKVALNKVLKQIKKPGAARGLDIVAGHIVEKSTVKKLNK